MSALIYIHGHMDDGMGEFWVHGGTLKNESHSIIWDLGPIWNDKPMPATLFDRLSNMGFEQFDSRDMGDADEIMEDLFCHYEDVFDVEIFKGFVCHVAYYYQIDLVAELRKES